jgi:hypothetical protein
VFVEFVARSIGAPSGLQAGQWHLRSAAIPQKLLAAFAADFLIHPCDRCVELGVCQEFSLYEKGAPHVA